MSKPLLSPLFHNTRALAHTHTPVVPAQTSATNPAATWGLRFQLTLLLAPLDLCKQSTKKEPLVKSPTETKEKKKKKYQEWWKKNKGNIPLRIHSRNTIIPRLRTFFFFFLGSKTCFVLWEVKSYYSSLSTKHGFSHISSILLETSLPTEASRGE